MTKQCNGCKLEKPKDEFYHVTKRGKLTIYHLCKMCCSDQKKVMKAYYRDWELKKKYGISMEEYQQLVANQDGRCSICNEAQPTLHVDHNHSTGKVRGMLCGSCNRALGLFQDNAELLRSAANYLDHHNEE